MLREHRIGSSLAALLLPAVVAAPAAGETYLASLEGPPVTVRYAPGSLDRADSVQRRFQRLIEQTGAKRWWQEPLLVVELREADDWRSVGLAEPYGLPAISAAGSLALPAWGTPETVAMWRELVPGGLPSPSGTPLRGSSEELAGLEAGDLVSEVEGSRLVLARLGLVGAERWIDDLLACALQVSAMEEYESLRRGEALRLFAALARQGETSGDERLLRLRWIAAAGRIGAETGKRPAGPLLKMLRKKREPLTADRLLTRFPWLAEYLPVGQTGNPG